MAVMGHETMCILKHSVIIQVYEDMLETFVVTTPENLSVDQTIIFQQDNESIMSRGKFCQMVSYQSKT